MAEAGGPANLFDASRNDTVFSLPDIADTIGHPQASLIGAGAACRHRVGVNAELVASEYLADGKQCRASKSIKVNEHDASKWELAEYDYDKIGMMINLLVSDGNPGKVVRVTAKKRLGGKNDNFISCIRKGLTAHCESLVTASDPSESDTKSSLVDGKYLPHIALGGVFTTKQGTVRTHVMPEFPKPPNILTEGNVDDWLCFYSMSAGMTCCSTLISGDPTGGHLSLRLEHTHFFNTATGEGGHYHFSDTPDEIEYEAYFVPCHRIYRVNDPSKL
jgi:Domain of Unknown Function (DUF1907)